MGTFNEAVEAFGKAHDDVRALGEHALGVKYLDLIAIAAAAHDAGTTVVSGPWADAYLAAVQANTALRKAAYAVGYQLSPMKPPMVGPAILLTA